MVDITSYDGKTHKSTGCLGCDEEQGILDLSRGNVIRSKHFNVHQDYEVPIPGFFILSTKRHIFSYADFTDEELAEYITLKQIIRKGMREKLGIEHVYFFQNEDSSHHFHLWIFPRHSWMEPHGRKIQSVRPIMEYAKENLKTEGTFEVIDRVVDKMRYYVNTYKDRLK